MHQKECQKGNSIHIYYRSFNRYFVRPIMRPPHSHPHSHRSHLIWLRAVHFPGSWFSCQSLTSHSLVRRSLARGGSRGSAETNSGLFTSISFFHFLLVPFCTTKYEFSLLLLSHSLPVQCILFFLSGKLYGFQLFNRVHCLVSQQICHLVDFHVKKRRRKKQI